MCLVINSRIMTEEIFIKILNNTATDAEKSLFYKSIEENPDLRAMFQEYKNLYVISNYDSKKHIQLQKDSFVRFWRRVDPSKAYRMIDFWYRYAAVFVIALSLGFLIQFLIPVKKESPILSQSIEYTSEKGSVSTIHFEEGSAIWLSSGSNITIIKSSDGKMNAQLSGEAYFDLIPDATRDFTVDLVYFKVKDIGTKFNIRSYDAEHCIYTTLVDGQINLFSKVDKEMLSLKPGEYLQYDKQSKQIDISQRDPSIATAWKDGKFVFIDKTLEEICRELENWYNVEITISKKSLAKNKYTSVIKRTTTVNLVLKMLSLTDKINYKITDRKEARDIVTIY